MKRTELKIDGKTYPCFQTMYGAMIFNEVTGHELANFDNTSTRDICAFAYGCAKGACLREGVEFPFSFDLFCAWLTPEEMFDVCGRLNDTHEDPKPSQKKMTRGS